MDQRFREDDDVARVDCWLDDVVRLPIVHAHFVRDVRGDVALVAARNTAEAAVALAGRTQAERDHCEPVANHSVAIAVPVIGSLVRTGAAVQDLPGTTLDGVDEKVVIEAKVRTDELDQIGHDGRMIDERLIWRSPRRGIEDAVVLELVGQRWALSIGELVQRCDFARGQDLLEDEVALQVEQEALLGCHRPILITMSELARKEVVALLRRLRPAVTEHALVRFGPVGDGGYLVPDDIEGIAACFSPGVGLVYGFESDCAAAGMQVFMADGSVDGPGAGCDAFHFVKRNVGSGADGDTTTLDRWLAESLPESKSDLLLQMDIEGAEFDALLHTSDGVLARFRIIVVEFHEFHRLAHRDFFDRASATFDKLLRNHICVHIHPNNCCGNAEVAGVQVPDIAEFTFLRRDRVSRRWRRRFVRTFPNPLDADNVPTNSSLLLADVLIG